MWALRMAAVFVFATGLLALAGCGGGPQMSEVEGTVKLKGKPLDKIHIEFWPEGSGPRSIGMTDAEGKYTLMSDDGKKTGALVGTHRIVLRDTAAMGDKFLGRAGDGADYSKMPKPRISGVYADAHKTTLKKEVSAGKNVINLDVTP